MFDVFSFLAVFLFFIVIIKVFHLDSSANVPQLHFSNSEFNKAILSRCQLLLHPYIPTFLWGKSGHVQTILYGKVGRVNSPIPEGDRHQIVMSDGATFTFDLFHQVETCSKTDCTLIVCPGIANSSESVTIRTFTDYAQKMGFRVAVLNHLGAIKSIPLTAPRIYTYGDTEEYAAMVDEVMRRYPSSSFIAVGFSMGGNIVVKYLGEDPKRQSKFLGAISCCQGYDVLGILPLLMSWKHFRRLYVWAMTRHQLGILRRNRHVLFESNCKVYDMTRILSATSLYEIDKCYSYKRAGFESLEDYYNWASSKFYFEKLHLPMFILNSLDDPIVPPEVHYIPREHAARQDNVIFATTPYGGHLGYFEGGYIVPNTITWLDRMVVEYCNSLLAVHSLNQEDKKN